MTNFEKRCREIDAEIKNERDVLNSTPKVISATDIEQHEIAKRSYQDRAAGLTH